MKLVFVMAGAAHGGAETFSMDLARGLHRKGIEILVITRNDPDRVADLKQNGIPHETLPFGTFLDFKTRPKLNKIIQRFNPDIVQTFMGRASSYYTPGPRKHIGWFGGYYDLKRFKDCDAYVGVTYDIAAHIHNQGAPLEKTHTIHTFADMDLDSPALKRADYDTPDDAKLFCALARLHWKKGLDTLLDAFAKIEDPKAYLWIAGSGEDEQKLTQQMHHLGLADRVRFIGWQNDRAAILNASDYCAFPSRYEPFGTVMVEAWATKTPIIAAASQGPAAYMKNEENGLLIDIDDTDGLTTAMNRLLTEPDLCEKIIQGGLQTYQETFTEDAVIAEYMDLYNSLLDAGNARKTA